MGKELQGTPACQQDGEQLVVAQAVIRLNDAAGEIEQSVIGAVLTADSPITAWKAASEHITGTDFGSSVNREVWAVITALAMNSVEPDMSSMVSRLRASGDFDRLGEYLFQCSEACGSSLLVGSYAASIRKISLRRQLLKIGDQVQKLALDTETEPEGCISEASSLLREIAGKSTGGWVTGGDAIQSIMARSVESDLPGLSCEQFAIPCVSTGLRFLDEFLHGGYMPASLNVVAARSSQGKSAFAISSAVNLLRAGKRVAVLSFEMTAESYGLRFTAQMSGVPSWKIRQGLLTDSDYDNWVNAGDEITRWGENFNLYASPAPVAEKLLWMIECAVDNGAEYVFVDHVGIVPEGGKSRYESQSAVADAMLAAKLRTNVPIIALAQFNRANEKDLRQPTMADIRDSGKWEENSDLVIGIHRPAQFSRDDSIKNYLRSNREVPEPVYVGVLKNREGETGMVECEFYSPLAQFRQGMGGSMLRSMLGI